MNGYTSKFCFTYRCLLSVTAIFALTYSLPATAQELEHTPEIVNEPSNNTCRDDFLIEHGICIGEDRACRKAGEKEVIGECLEDAEDDYGAAKRGCYLAPGNLVDCLEQARVDYEHDKDLCRAQLRGIAEPGVYVECGNEYIECAQGAYSRYLECLGENPLP